MYFITDMNMLRYKAYDEPGYFSSQNIAPQDFDAVCSCFVYGLLLFGLWGLLSY